MLTSILQSMHFKDEMSLEQNEITAGKIHE